MNLVLLHVQEHATQARYMNQEHVVHTKVKGGSVIMHLYGRSGILEVWKFPHINAETTARYVVGVVAMWGETVRAKITECKFHNNVATNDVNSLLREGDDG